MQRICSVCKREFNERDMEHYFNGRRTMWLCLECDRNAQRQNTQSEIYRNTKRQKLMNKKER